VWRCLLLVGSQYVICLTSHLWPLEVEMTPILFENLCTFGVIRVFEIKYLKKSYLLFVSVLMKTFVAIVPAYSNLIGSHWL